VNVSLNQAIEIHAKVLAHRFGDRAGAGDCPSRTCFTKFGVTLYLVSP
jgi:hypothetical protein